MRYEEMKSVSEQLSNKQGNGDKTKLYLRRIDENGQRRTAGICFRPNKCCTFQILAPI